MNCLFCGKDFDIIGQGSGGKNRLFCYDCYPANMPRKQRNQHLRYLKQTMYDNQKLQLGCSVCGYNKCASALEWHHPNGDKINEPSCLRGRSVEQYLQETSKCILLCSNCHRELHSKEKNDYVLPSLNTYEKQSLEIEKQIIEQYHKIKSYKGVAKKLNINAEYVKKICDKYNLFYERNNNKKPVAMLNLNTGQVEKTFDSISSALIYLNKKTSLGGKISRACKNDRFSAFGYKWKYI